MKYIKYFEGLNDFMYDNRFLTTLNKLEIPLPDHIKGDFYCRNNKLTSLEGGPKIVDYVFNCTQNKLTTLEFCPNYVGSNFNCSHNELTTLEFFPEYVGGILDCSNNKLTSIDNIALYSIDMIYCSNNNWIDVIPYKIYLNAFDSPYTDNQYFKFRSYEYQKEFLTKTPEKYNDLESVGYVNGIKEEFDWLFNAIDMGLM